MAKKYDDRIPGSITKQADSSRERISEISNVNNTISQMQRNIDQKIKDAENEIDYKENTKEVQNSMLKVLSIMGTTVGSIGHGFTKIAEGTARATSDAVKDYGRAISQDININKQNLLATTLASSTPIFGYFASKFMETDVFNKAKEKMKENIASALGGVTAKFRQGFSGLTNIFRGGKKKKGKNVTGRIDLDSYSEDNKIPKMSRGGFVKKEGLAHLHAGEVIMPIEKILDRIDESIGVGRDLAQISKRMQLNTMAKMDRFIAYGADTSKKNIFSAFISAAKSVNTQYEQPAETRMLRALIAIQNAVGAQNQNLQQIWSKILVEHPTFRNMVFFLKGLNIVLASPFKLIYAVLKTRGGYKSELSNAKNPMQAAAENIGVLHIGSMIRLDAIVNYTKASAEAARDMSSAITGKKYQPLEGVKQGFWTIAGLAKSLMKGIVTTTMGIDGLVNRAAVRLTEKKTSEREKKLIEMKENRQRSIDAFNNFIKKYDKDVSISTKTKKQRKEILGGVGGTEGTKQLNKIIEVSTKQNEGIEQLNNVIDISTKRNEIMTAVYEETQKVGGIEGTKQLNKIIEVSTKQNEGIEQLNNVIDISTKRNEIMTAVYEETQKVAAAGGSGGIYSGPSNKPGFSPVIVYDSESVRQAKLTNAISEEQSKKQDKVVSNVVAFRKVTEEINRRSIRQAMYGGVGQVKKIFTSVLGLLPMLGMFLGGGAGGGFIGKIIKSIIPKGVLTAISTIGKLGKTVLGPLGKLGAKGLAVAGSGLMKILTILTSSVLLKGIIAAYAGWKTGKFINEKLKLEERTQKRFKASDERDKDARARVEEKTGTTQERLESIRTGSEKGFKDRKILALQRSIGHGIHDTGKRSGFFGRAYLTEIQTAQEEYMINNLDRYMQYSPQELDALRKKWSAGRTSKKFIFEKPADYGNRREREFMAYVSKHGTKLTEGEHQTAYDSYAKAQIEHGHAEPGIMERASKVIVDSSTMAKDALVKGIADSKMVEGLHDLTEVMKDKTDELKNTVAQSATYITSGVTTSINNTSNVVNNAKQSAHEAGSFTKSILQGNLFEESFSM